MNRKIDQNAIKKAMLEAKKSAAELEELRKSLESLKSGIPIVPLTTTSSVNINALTASSIYDQDATKNGWRNIIDAGTRVYECPTCYNLVAEDRIDAHIAAVHADQIMADLKEWTGGNNNP